MKTTSPCSAHVSTEWHVHSNNHNNVIGGEDELPHGTQHRLGPNHTVAVCHSPSGEFSDTMCPDDPSQSRSTAIEQLETFGLSTSAAQTFVALVGLGEGTARDVSAVSQVPRTRVYDAAAELHDQGLVDIQHSSPKRFTAISAETTGRKFHQEYAHRVNVLTDALDDLEPIGRSAEQRGVWTVTGREAVTDRVVEFIEDADDEVVFMTVEDLLTEACLDALRAAADSDVTVRLAGVSPPVQAEIQAEIPEMQPFESIWEWTDLPAGRLLMVDEEKTLASVLVSGNGDHPPELNDETAIWGTGEPTSLVVVLEGLFTW